MRTPPFQVPEGFEVNHLRVHDPEYPAWHVFTEATDHDIYISVEELEDGSYGFDAVCTAAWCKFPRVMEWNTTIEKVEELIFAAAENMINTNCEENT